VTTRYDIRVTGSRLPTLSSKRDYPLQGPAIVGLRQNRYPKQRFRRIVGMVLRDLLRMVMFGVLGVGAFGACSCSNPQTTQASQALVKSVEPLKATTTQRATAQATGHAFVKTYSVANMKHDVLDDCIDFTVSVEQPLGATPEWAFKDAPDLRAELGKFGTQIRRSCTEQFADRLVLATCIAITKRDGQELQLVERYYDPATVGMEDLYMQECLRLGGTWEAIATDSPEFRKAAARARLRGLESLAAGSG
jgi:hypothetical protein